MTTYRTIANQRINLGIELAKGGEGIVFDVQGDQRVVAKIYHDSKLKAGNELEAKLQAMLANPPRDRDQAIVWPTHLLYDDWKFVGYLMPRLQQTIDLFELYNPQQRQAKHLGTDWKYLHTVARNLATAFWTLHQAGYVMGDVNQKNVLVELNGTIRLVDTDSFQVQGRNGRVFRCSVGVPEYTPSEMRHHKDLSKVDRNPSQDAFGLGILVFQLLMEGFHPFTGAPKKPAFSVQQPVMEYCIEQGIFPYDSKSRNQYVPPPNAPDFNNLHSEVKKLFIKCFVDGHSNPASRPSAMDWCKALTIAIQDLKQCAKDKTHWYFPSNGNCPWCAKHTARTQPMPPQPTYVPTISPPIPQPYQPPVAPPAPRQATVSGNRAALWVAILLVLLGSTYTIFNTISFESIRDVTGISIELPDQTPRNSGGVAFTQVPQRPTRIPPTRTPPRIAQAQTTFSGSINTARLNVRIGPSANDYIVFRVSQGDTVQILGRNNTSTWLVIDAGVVGWVNAEYVRTSGNLSSLYVYRSDESLPSSSRQMVFSCPSARGPSFQINDRFIVPFGDGPTTIWSEPNRQPRVTRVPEGDGGVILGGPICTGAQEGNLVFWYVRSDSGFEGYISEGYRDSPVAWIAPTN